MKKLYLILLLGFFGQSLSAQNFNSVNDVYKYLGGKTFEAKFENGNTVTLSFESFDYYIKLNANDDRFFSTNDNKEDIIILSSTKAALTFYERINPDVMIRIIVDCSTNKLADRSSGRIYYLIKKDI